MEQAAKDVGSTGVLEGRGLNTNWCNILQSLNKIIFMVSFIMVIYMKSDLNTTKGVVGLGQYEKKLKHMSL